MMHIDVNWLAIVLAMIASMALGMAWYMALEKPWLAASGRTQEDVQGERSRSPFIWAAVAQLIMAFFIAMLTPALMGEVNWYNAMLVGAHMWLGFIATSMILNHRYQGRPWALTFIDGGYLLGVVLLHGLIIGLFG